MFLPDFTNVLYLLVPLFSCDTSSLLFDRRLSISGVLFQVSLRWPLYQAYLFSFSLRYGILLISCDFMVLDIGSTWLFVYFTRAVYRGLFFSPPVRVVSLIWHCEACSRCWISLSPSPPCGYRRRCDPGCGICFFILSSCCPQVVGFGRQ